MTGLGRPVVAFLALALVMGAAAPAMACRASWYNRGAVTASGLPFRADGLSIALRSYHFGDRYRVGYRGRSVVVVHNDFGPALRLHRCGDLSYGAAKALGMLAVGVASVTIQRVD